MPLSSKKDNRFDLSRNKKAQKYTLATKFFTRRSVNIEAVAKTFRPLWHTRRKFEVSNAGDNILLFTCESDEDIERSSWENLGRSTDTWWFSSDMICLLLLRTFRLIGFRFGFRFIICHTPYYQARWLVV